MTKKALIVDSDFFFVEFLGGVLERHGYQVRKAYDGKQGIALLGEGPFDVLFAELVMPKVSGRQFFQFVRQKSNGRCAPLVAISGTMIEHMEEMDGLEADYFIAKGPLQKLEVYLHELLREVDNRTGLPPVEKRIRHTEGVFPRRDAVELLRQQRFQQAVVESLATGLIVVDKDTRIIGANAAALGLLDKRLEDLLNIPVPGILPPGRKAELISAMRRTGGGAEEAPSALIIKLKGRMTRLVVSALTVDHAAAGWVLAIEGAGG
jgi:DNA-binding response OmpR family regulator